MKVIAIVAVLLLCLAELAGAYSTSEVLPRNIVDSTSDWNYLFGRNSYSPMVPGSIYVYSNPSGSKLLKIYGPVRLPKGHEYKYGMYGSTKQKFKLGIRTRFDIRSNFFVYGNVGRGTINPVSVSNFEKGAKQKKKPGCLIWVEPFCITDSFSGYSHKLKELAGRTYPSEDCIEWIDKMKISGGATALERFTPKFNQHIYCRGIGMVYWRMGSMITKLDDYYIPGREQTRMLLKKQGAIPFGTKIENREIH